MKAVAALKTTLLLSVLFLAVYGPTNWLTAQRAGVGSMVFEWERHLPFVPWLIVPYMSIDLFFVVAPFLCADAVERRTYARRVILAIVLAGACFLLYPLKFSFERPTTGGWIGAVFDLFRTMDQPFNQLPSLHIALLLIIAGTFDRHASGLVRTALRAWFVLIGVSTVLTYQHHMVDVAGGLLLGAFCYHVFADDIPARELTPNRRVGCYYAIGALAALLAMCWLPAEGVFMVWPAGGLGMVACAYFTGGSAVFKKSRGRIPWGTRVWLAPILLGQRLSLIHYRRKCRPWDQVCPGLWIGGKLEPARARAAIEGGVSAVLDLTGEFAETPAFLELPYLNIPVLDLTAPTRRQFSQALDFIDQQIVGGTVYVHCKIGFSRSAAVAMAWLIRSGRAASTAEAVAILRAARPPVVIRPEIIPAVENFIGWSHN